MPHSEHQVRCLKAMGLTAWQSKPAFKDDTSAHESRFYACEYQSKKVIVVVDFMGGDASLVQQQETMLEAMLKAMTFTLLHQSPDYSDDPATVGVLALGSRSLAQVIPNVHASLGVIESKGSLHYVCVDSLVAMIRNPALKNRTWQAMQRFKKEVDA